VTAVAVWDRKPSADELLERRLEEGWQATPTRLKEGPTVLGHACRLQFPVSHFHSELSSHNTAIGADR
jgi:hypothetical protein